jgi:hypothetical protein
MHTTTGAAERAAGIIAHHHHHHHHRATITPLSRPRSRLAPRSRRLASRLPACRGPSIHIGERGRESCTCSAMSSVSVPASSQNGSSKSQSIQSPDHDNYDAEVVLDQLLDRQPLSTHAVTRPVREHEGGACTHGEDRTSSEEAKGRAGEQLPGRPDASPPTRDAPQVVSIQEASVKAATCAPASALPSTQRPRPAPSIPSCTLW